MGPTQRQDAVAASSRAAAAQSTLERMLLLCSTDISLSGRTAVRVTTELAERLDAELAFLDMGAGDPSRRLLRAAHATGCDLLVVGYMARSGIGSTLPPGWQRRIVLDTPCPVMLVPGHAVLPRDSGVVLGDDVTELPHQAAKTAARLAGRLRTPLMITDVLAGGRTPRSASRQLYDSAPIKEEDVLGGTLRVRQPEREPSASDQLVRTAAMREAALVVIGGRSTGRGLLPHRSVARGPQNSRRLPVIVTASRLRGATEGRRPTR
jgi:nucleotide-binding universal stress UspA family protein